MAGASGSERWRIVFVHGLGRKPPAADKHALLLLALEGGLRREHADAASMLAASPGRLESVYWADLVYPDPLDPAAERDAVHRALERDAADRVDRRAARALRRRLRSTLNRLADRFPRLISRFADARVAVHLAAARRYFDRASGLGGRVRRRLHAALDSAHAADGRVLLIGHSMGSVVALDTLWERTHLLAPSARVALFMTMGSPLGTRWVRSRLLGARSEGRERWAGGVDRWINLSAAGDLTAIHPRLAPLFEPATRLDLIGRIEDAAPIDTWYRDHGGLNVHKSYGYLMHPDVAGIVADWLCPGDDAISRRP